MNTDLLPEDHSGLTCPYVFKKPASPHLASQLENITIDTDKITRATQQLKAKYDCILLEGAGGLMVPLNKDLLLIDYVAAVNQFKNATGYPTILVTSGKLGSINQTILSIEALLKRSLSLFAIIYNKWQPKSDVYDYDEKINTDSKRYLKQYIKKVSPQTHLLQLNNLDLSNSHTQTSAFVMDSALHSCLEDIVYNIKKPQ